MPLPHSDGTNGSGVNDTDDVSPSDSEVPEGEQLILDIIRQNDRVTIKQISAETGLSRRTVDRIIAALKEQKKLERTGSSRSGEWKVL